MAREHLEVGAPLSPPTLWILSGLAVALLAFVYHTVAEATAGTTLGKAILGLYVRNEGDRGRLAAVALRNGLRLADGIGLYAVGMIVALFTSRHRRIGDLVGGTVVLHDDVPAVARAVLLATFVALVGTALWIAAAICPECAAALRDGVASGAVEIAGR